MLTSIRCVTPLAEAGGDVPAAIPLLAAGCSRHVFATPAAPVAAAAAGKTRDRPGRQVRAAGGSSW